MERDDRIDPEYAVLRDFRKIRLCTYVLEELSEELTEPMTAQDKANLLLAVEEMASSAIILLEQTRGIVWTEDLKAPTEYS